MGKAIVSDVRFFSYVICFCITFSACDTSNNVKPRFADYFLKYYGVEGDQEGVDFLPTQDGGFILLGSTTTLENGWDMYLVKVDNFGNEQWHKFYGRPQDDRAKAVQILDDNSMVIAADSENELGNTDILLVKLDTDGTELTRVVLGDETHNEEISSLQITWDGGLLIAGSSSNTEAFPKGTTSPDDSYDFYFPRTDENLNPLEEVQWLQRNGFDGFDKLSVGLQKDTNKFLFFGTSDVRPANNSQKDGNNIILFQTAGNGISDTGDQLFGTLSDEISSSVTPTSDGGFVVVGSTQIEDGINDIFVARVRSDNSFLSQGVINTGLNIKGKAITETVGGGFVVTGDQFENNKSNIYLLRLDNLGAIVWAREFGGGEDDTVGKVIQLPNESFIFIGTITLENQTKMCLIKTNPSGELAP